MNFEQAFKGDGRTTRFALVEEPASAAHVLLVMDGSLQTPGISYSVDGQHLVFCDGEAPADGSECSYRILRSDALLALEAGK